MLQRAHQQRFYLNNKLQGSVNDTDTKFTCNLGTIVKDCVRINLDSFCCDNLFLNIEDISLEIEGYGYVQLIPQYYLTLFNLTDYINSITTPLGLTLHVTNNNISSFEDVLQLTADFGNPRFKLTGQTWFDQLGMVYGINDVFNTIQQSQSPPDFGQTSTIFVQISTIPYSITNSVSAQFQINNTSAYKSKQSFYGYNFNSNNSVVFSNPQQFSQLQVTLLDSQGHQLRTPNFNRSDIEVSMMFSSYDS